MTRTVPREHPFILKAFRTYLQFVNSGLYFKKEHILGLENVPVNGTFTGAYEIEDGVLTLTYYIYGNAITNSYTYEISGNSLKLTNTEDSKISTYIKQ